MKKLSKRIISVFIAVVMITAVIPANAAFAVDEPSAQFNITKLSETDTGVVINVNLVDGSFNALDFTVTSSEMLSCKSITKGANYKLFEESCDEEGNNPCSFFGYSLTKKVGIATTKAYSEKGAVATYTFTKDEPRDITSDDISITIDSCNIRDSSGNLVAVNTAVASGIEDGVDIEAVEYVSLDKSALSVNKGYTAQLTATVYPSTALNKSVTYLSSNPSVATVDKNGKISAISSGTTIITVTTVDGGKTDTCKVSVNTPTESVLLTEKSKKISLGTTYKMTVNIKPTDATDQVCSWTSSDASVASVSSLGEITPKKRGTTIITVKCAGITDTCNVTVLAGVNSLTLNKSNASLYVGGSVALTPTLLPTNADDKTVTWTSSDKSIATVNSSGVVTAVGGGSAKITCTSNDDFGKSDVCNVTVGIKPATNLKTVAASSTAIKITWSAVLGAKSYLIMQNGVIIQNSATTSCSYIVKSLTTGKSYSFKIVAYTVDITKLSISNIGKLTIKSTSSAITAKALPAKITGVKAVSKSYNSLTLSWTKSDDVSGYNIYRSTTGKSGSWKKVSVVKASASSYVSTGLTTGKTYYFLVKAYKSVNNENYFADNSAAVSAKPIPATPTGVKAKKKSSTSITVTWGKVSGATGYVVYRSETGKAGSWSKIKTTANSSYTNTSLKKGKKYYYCVKAYRKVGNSNIFGNTSAKSYVQL